MEVGGPRAGSRSPCCRQDRLSQKSFRPGLFMGESLPAVTNSLKLTVPPRGDSASGPRGRQLPPGLWLGGHFDPLSGGVRVGDPAKVHASGLWTREGEAGPGILRKIEEGTHSTDVCNWGDGHCPPNLPTPTRAALLYLVICSSSVHYAGSHRSGLFPCMSSRYVHHVHLAKGKRAHRGHPVCRWLS